MRLIVNGEMMEVRGRHGSPPDAPMPGTSTSEGPTLADILSLFDYTGAWLATAVNGELVPRTARDTHSIRDGDRIEILTPLQGG